jgi:hypothetical protein
MPVVRAITKSAEADDYRFSAIVKGIVHSVPFRMKQKESGQQAVPATTTIATQ